MRKKEKTSEDRGRIAKTDQVNAPTYENASMLA